MAGNYRSLAEQSKALGKRLSAIPADMVQELRPALVKGAHDIQDAMELLVPQDQGDLLGSIQVTGPGQTTPTYAAGGGVTLLDTQAAVTVGNPDVRHGHDRPRRRDRSALARNLTARRRRHRLQRELRGG